MDDLIELFDAASIDISSHIRNFQTAEPPEIWTDRPETWWCWKRLKFIQRTQRLLTDIHNILNGPNMRTHPMYDDFAVLQFEDVVAQTLHKLDVLSFYEIQRQRDPLFGFVMEQLTHLAQCLQK